MKMKLVQLPHKFHIEQISLNARCGLNTFNIKLEVRDLMLIHRVLCKRRCGTKISIKIEEFLNSYADIYGYNDFKIDDKISQNFIGVQND